MPPRIIVSEETKKKLREASSIKDKYAELADPVVAGGFDWRLVDVGILGACVASVTRAGDCISFSVTSDGGAGVVTILSTGAPVKKYPPSVQAAEALLKRLTDINQ